MSKTSDHKWTKKHTQALNHLLYAANERLKLKIANPNEPFDVWVDLDSSEDGATAGGVILSQGNRTEWKPIMLVGRDLSEAE